MAWVKSGLFASRLLSKWDLHRDLISFLFQSHIFCIFNVSAKRVGLGATGDTVETYSKYLCRVV